MFFNIDNNLCVKCNKCISVCPIKFSNDFSKDFVNVVVERCIGCGNCVENCPTNARFYKNKIEQCDGCGICNNQCVNSEKTNKTPDYYLFDGIKTPIDQFQFEREDLLIDISFLFEMLAISYSQILFEKNLIISSLCPAIVRYIERYRPDLIKYLAEITDFYDLTSNYINSKKLDYNFTIYNSCPHYLNRNLGNISFYPIEKIPKKEISFSQDNSRIKAKLKNEDLNFLNFIPKNRDIFSLLKKYTDKKINIVSIYGIQNVIKFLEIYKFYDIGDNRNIILDLKSCFHCPSYGSSLNYNINNNLDFSDNEITIYKELSSIEYKKSFINNFDKSQIEEPDNDTIKSIYIDLKKNNQRDIINCSSCGYDSCINMAKAIYNSLNKKENCIFYLKNNLIHTAYHDELTQLKNRNALKKDLEETIILENQLNIINEKIIIMLDICGFREINESYSNDVGDEILKRISMRLNSVIDDNCELYRIGSDEFAIIINGCNDYNVVNIFIHNIQEVFSTSLSINGNNIFIQFNIGYSFYPSDGDISELIIKNTETALNEAKLTKKLYIKFEKSLNDKVTDKLNTISRLRNAIENRNFSLYYQGQFSLEGKIVGAEALIRWIEPIEGIIPPNDFIGYAEESGLIIPIGEWIIDQVCKDINYMNSHKIFLPISINISVKQFKDKDFIKKIENILKANNISPTQLHLEITESIMVDKEESISNISHLNKLGFKISIDDFGTGYSCLNYLNKFSLNALKIDKSFIDLIEHASNDIPLVDTIVSMGKNMKLDLVAEGISKQTQIDYLRKFDYDIALQGFYFSQPIPLNDFITMIKKNNFLVKNNNSI